MPFGRVFILSASSAASFSHSQDSKLTFRRRLIRATLAALWATGGNETQTSAGNAKILFSGNSLGASLFSPGGKRSRIDSGNFYTCPSFPAGAASLNAFASAKPQHFLVQI